MNLSAKRVLVMGLGRFGGGVGVVKYLNKCGAEVLVTDLCSAEQLHDSLAQLAGLPIHYRLGRHLLSDFQNADLVVVNPAVDGRGNPYLHAAAEAGVPLTTEVRLLIEALPAGNRTIGVTGTAGKSTVTAMIGHILARAWGSDRVHVGGNLGGSLLDDADRWQKEDWFVLELSSFMLEALAPCRWSPCVAVVTNLQPNHLDRHGNMRAYAEAKQVLLDHQGLGDHAVLGPRVGRWFSPRAEHVSCVAVPPTPPMPLRLPGEHNQINAVLATRACGAVGVEHAEAIEAIKSFAGLPHRLQWVGEYGGVRYVNDSKSTTPHAAQMAIRCLAPPAGSGRSLHVILGGYDKGSDLTGLARLAAQQCRVIYTIGATADAINRVAQLPPEAPLESSAEPVAGEHRVIPCGTLDRAVDEVFKRARVGDTVLLSPGCASWDQFDSFVQRGDAFIRAVHRLEPPIPD